MSGQARRFTLASVLLLSGTLWAGTTTAAQIFFQGFETDNAGWNIGLYGPQSDATRVASGTNGVPSSSGGFHAEAAGPFQWDTSNGSAFTRWGGYGFTPGCSGNGCAASFPAGGFTTSLDIYLNVGGGAANDTRFDWDTAVNQSSGAFLRDFVFNGGFYNDVPGGGPRFVISASNNAGRGSSYPNNPGRNPFTISNTGWYTFQERFYDNAGFLAADLSILDSANAVLHSWTLNTTDNIAGVGGNRYGFMLTNEFGFLAIDNASLVTAQLPEPPSLALLALVLAGLACTRRKGAS